MSIAVAADAAAVQQRWDGFLDELKARFPGELDDAAPPTLERVRHRFQTPHIITTISTEGVCEIKVHKEGRHAQISLLLPRGVDQDKLYPILLEGLNEALRRYPEAVDWRVWASFYYAVDENGEPDAGESECKAWLPYFPGASTDPGDTGWVIESRLGEAARGR